jgi:hypothetical protein
MVEPKDIDILKMDFSFGRSVQPYGDEDRITELVGELTLGKLQEPPVQFDTEVGRMMLLESGLLATSTVTLFNSSGQLVDADTTPQVKKAPKGIVVGASLSDSFEATVNAHRWDYGQYPAVFLGKKVLSELVVWATQYELSEFPDEIDTPDIFVMRTLLEASKMHSDKLKLFNIPNIGK